MLASLSKFKLRNYELMEVVACLEMLIADLNIFYFLFNSD
jgi:hypothetical protein